MSDMLELHQPNRLLHSASQMLLVQSRWNLKTCGYRSFAVQGPLCWNSLPNHIINIDKIDEFKSNLKTVYFKQAYRVNVIFFTL